jgi:2-dehydro-3-deoxyphosphogluconate aldolase/(4S)-4-hydroxy-2-oxoglutarate aldolase
MLQPFDHGPVIPILTFDSVDHVVPTVAALLEGGLRAVEITLRTPVALAAIEIIAKAYPGLPLGASLVLRPADVTAARRAGANFLVSPGLTPSLAAAGLASGLAFVPGAATASEVMAARELGFPSLRYYPAQEAGGVAMLAAFAGVFTGIEFCPAGGLGPATAAAYLSLANVPAVAGSWIASRDAITAGDWSGISARARAAAALTRSA